MKIRCFVDGCKVEENSNDIRIDLENDHIIPKSWFPESYNLGKKYDMIEIDGKLVSNREYLCKKHHRIKSELYLDWIPNGLPIELKKRLSEYLYHKYYSEFKKLGAYENPNTTEQKGI